MQYSVKQSTIEQIFNRFANDQAQEMASKNLKDQARQNPQGEFAIEMGAIYNNRAISSLNNLNDPQARNFTEENSKTEAAIPLD